MDDSDQRLPEAFARLLQAPGSEREALLDALCNDDPTLRDELAGLLRVAEDVTGGMHPFGDHAIEARRQALDAAIESPSPIEARSTIAGYTIERMLGEGGMGSVYLATQERPARQVALKLVKSGFSSERALRRFELEAETLGRLRHPGIAQIHEAGLHQGRPFFAMEFVDGLTLTEYADAKNLGTRARLKLIAQIAAAVQHAHQQGVIHRDLKPGNILVTEVETDKGRVAQPKVLDFGVAKVTESDIRATTMQTDIGQLVGTIPYMSPEQAGGDPAALDTRSDVYALGVLAFELLSGRLPHDLKDRMVHEAVRIIREDEPSRLSAINTSLRGDVETIVAKALEKKPDRRYDSPSALASDIGRYLDDQPIQARPASTWYQLRKFSRRNRALVGGVAATFAVLVAGVVGTTVFAVRAETARLEADRSAEQAEVALAAETERATELERAIRFQDGQITRVNQEVMGAGIRDSIIRAAPEDSREQLLQTLEPINFTDVAVASLERDVIQRAIEAIDTEFEDNPRLRARLLNAAGVTLRSIGRSRSAEDPQRRALEILVESHGEDHVLTYMAKEAYAHVIEDQRRFDEAEVLRRDAYEGLKASVGEHDPRTLMALDHLGALMWSMNRKEEAETYHRASLDGRAATLGENHTATLTAAANLAKVLDGLEKFGEAESMFRRAMDGFRVTLGDDHPETLGHINNLGMWLSMNRRAEEAEPLLQESLEGFRRVLGNDHANTLATVSNLAICLKRLDRLEEALPLYEEALDNMRRTQGLRSPNTLIAMNNMGATLRTLERLEEAEAIGAEAVAGLREVLPPGHWVLGTATGQHGRTLLALGRREAAEPRMIETYKIFSTALSPTHPYSKTALNEIITAYEAWHEAEPDAGHDVKAAEWRAKLPSEDNDAE
ncbi:MAG: serine/threonine-protein kinase [Planctomycetota bacterium]